MPPAFDTIYVGGSAFTGGWAQSRPLGVAIKDGVIAAIEADSTLRDAGAENVVELNGGMVMPAFHDAHAHPVAAGIELLECDLTSAQDAEEAISLIRAFAATHAEAKWIRGGGWTLAHFPGGTPTTSILDGLEEIAGRPVALMNRDHHGMWVNSEALQRAEISARTPDPSDGRIERFVDGSPSGVLHEGAMALVQQIIPPLDFEQKEQGLAIAQREYFNHGIVGWQDAWVGIMPGIGDTFETYFEAAKNDKLSARVTAALWWDRERGLEQIPELVDLRERVQQLNRPDILISDTIKVMVDGIPENFTAALSHPYKDAHGHSTQNSGLTFLDPETLREVVAALDAAEFNIHFHSLGDRAVTLALDSLEAAVELNTRRSPRRHHLAHLQMVQSSDVERFVSTGSWANMQMLWAAVDEQLDTLTFPFIEESLVPRHYPFAELHKAAVKLAAGSDWPVSTQNPLAAIHVGVNRAAPGTQTDPRMREDQRLGLATCLTAYTAGSAEVNGRAQRSGRLETGLLADIVVLNRDPFDYPSSEIYETRVVSTTLSGDTVTAITT